MKRPASIVVLGVLGVVFACMGLLVAGLSHAAGGQAAPFGPFADGLARLLESSRVGSELLAARPAAAVVLNLWLLIASVGLLRWRTWGRGAALGWAGASLLWQLAFIGVVVAHARAAGPFESTDTAYVGAVLAIELTAFTLLLPTVMLVFLLLPGVAAAYRSIARGESVAFG